MILVSGGSGLIGGAIRKHLSINSYRVYNYDLDPGNLKDYENQPHTFISASQPLESTVSLLPIEFGAFIDCARYSDQKDQIATWHTVIKQLQRKGAGRMILFSSIYGHVAPDFSIYPGTEIQETPLEYAMQKAAVEQATRFLAQKLKPYNIQVNCIAPGGVFNNHSDEFHANYVHAGRTAMIEPKNILPVIDMLLHPDNAVNGQVITVSGGWEL